jgi:hypothetical protein
MFLQKKLLALIQVSETATPLSFHHVCKSVRNLAIVSTLLEKYNEDMMSTFSLLFKYHYLDLYLG